MAFGFGIYGDSACKLAACASRKFRFNPLIFKMNEPAARWIKRGFAFIAAYFIFIWAVSWVSVWTVERRSGMIIHGSWRPSHWLPGHFQLNQVQMDWRDRFQVRSGQIKIDFDLLEFLFVKKFITIAGSDLQVELGKKYSHLSARRQIKIDRIEGSFELSSSGEPIVHSLEIESPEIQFNVKAK